MNGAHTEQIGGSCVIKGERARERRVIQGLTANWPAAWRKQGPMARSNS